MILLEPYNRMVFDTLRTLFDTPADRRDTHLHIVAGDFDGAHFVLKADEADPSRAVRVGLMMRGFRECMDNGAAEMLAELYPEAERGTNLDGCNVTLRVDLEAPRERPELLCNRIASVKRNILAAPLRKCINAIKAGRGRDASRVVIPYRDEESIFILTGADTLTVTLSLKLQHEDDIVMGRVFLKQLNDAKKTGIRNPPSVVRLDWERKPAELRDVPGVPENAVNVGYVTIVLFDKNWEGDAVERSVDNVIMYRNYLHYHLKCAKANLHIRQRRSVREMLEVLNRAKEAMGAPPALAVGGSGSAAAGPSGSR